MYVTIKEIAEFLHLSERFIMDKVMEGKIRTVSDGNQLLVNKQHFDKTKDLLEMRLRELEEEKLQPIVEDFDVKDED